jgi:hypothetical protein
VRDAVSDYGAGPYRRWYQGAAVAIAVAGTTAGVALLASVAPSPVVPVTLLFIFSAARVLICIFPTDLEGRQRTRTGRIHMTLAVIAFACVATAAGMVGGAVQHDARWSGVAGTLGALGWALIGTTVLLLVTLSVGPVRRRLFGATERLFYLAMVAWFLALGAQLVSQAFGQNR